MGERGEGPTLTGPTGEELLVSSRLGWLYLDQEHVDDAERIFRAVLEWRGEDGEARDGLAATERRRRELAEERAARTRRVIAGLGRYLSIVRRAATVSPGDGRDRSAP